MGQDLLLAIRERIEGRFAALYEGFGLSVAQAMASGVAILASNTSCLPEIGAGGALYADPRGTVEWTAARERMLTSPAIRSEVGNAGRQHAQRNYTWPGNARRSVQFFHVVAGSLR